MGRRGPSQPLEVTEYGRSLLADSARPPRIIGYVISEAVSEAAVDPEVRYAWQRS